MWQLGETVEIEITDVSNSGEGVGRYEDRVVFVPDTVTGDIVKVRLEYLKPEYAQGKLIELVKASTNRIRPRCIVADKCGGCQWQHISDEYQAELKEHHLKTALARIGGFDDLVFAPMQKAQEPLGYRNKVTYPLARSATGAVQAGYYRPKSHTLINLNQCPVQDPHFNPLLAEIKQDIYTRNWSIYKEEEHRGLMRHLSLRIGRRTKEMLLTLVATSTKIPGLQEQAEIWLKRYPELVGVSLNVNSVKGNSIFGTESHSVAGKAYIREVFGGLELHLGPNTFFQVNTETAEQVLNLIIKELNLQGQEIILDAYCGVGTFTLPLARLAKEVIGIEIQEPSLAQAYYNAQLNGINNVTFYQGKVEDILPQLEISPDVILVDPPRKGCDREVIERLRFLRSPHLVYISCQPPTLARDLKLLTQDGVYRIVKVQAADFFPQTAHVESVVFLQASQP